MASETLVCQACDKQFERERTRGRKPKRCPDCKEQGNKPKADSKAEVIYKSEEEPRTSPVVDMATGKRLEGQPSVEIEVPDEAKMTNEVKWLRKYSRIIVDGIEYIGDGETTVKMRKTVKVKDHEHNGCRFRVSCFTHNTGNNVMYFELVGEAGMCMGKWRFIDPERVKY